MCVCAVRVVYLRPAGDAWADDVAFIGVRYLFFKEIYLQKCYIPENGENLNFLNDIKPYNALEYALKRVIDYVSCSLLLVILFVLKFYVKKKIDEQSPGSIYFLQNRVGLENREF